MVVNPVGLLAGELFVAPLYGTVAVLVREAARRAGRGRPTILLLCAAAGLAQAGLIDQSLFHPRRVRRHPVLAGQLRSEALGPQDSIDHVERLVAEL